MEDVTKLVQVVFSGLSPLVIEGLADEGERIVVRARTSQDTGVCLMCGASLGRVHGYHWRTVADVPGGGWWSACGLAAYARHNGTAPLPAWSSNRARHRPSRTGNRQLNAALHRIAMTQARCHQPVKDLITGRRNSDVGR